MESFLLLTPRHNTRSCLLRWPRPYLRASARHHSGHWAAARNWAHECYFDRNSRGVIRRVLCPKSARRLAAQHAPYAFHIRLRCPHFTDLLRDRTRHPFGPRAPRRSANAVPTVTLCPDVFHNVFGGGEATSVEWALTVMAEMRSVAATSRRCLRNAASSIARSSSNGSHLK